MARGNTGGAGTRCFEEIVAKCTDGVEESAMLIIVVGPAMLFSERRL
jgi:hypothetical protein